MPRVLNLRHPPYEKLKFVILKLHYQIIKFQALQRMCSLADLAEKCNVILRESCMIIIPFADVHSLRGHKGAAVRSLEFFPMEGYMASTSADATIKVGTS